jgi:hypothetical protein
MLLGMSESNGGPPAEPVPVLAGHLVIYPDAIAFRADGAETIVARALDSRVAGPLTDLFTEGDGGVLAALIAGDMSKLMGMMPGGMMGAIKAARRG